jgi:hypothetical protein
VASAISPAATNPAVSKDAAATPKLRSHDRQHDQRQRDAERPGVHEYCHRRGDLFAGEPVGDHFRHQHVEQHTADTRQQAARQLKLPAGRDRHRQPAADHQGEPGHDNGLVAVALADGAAWHGQRNAGGEVETDGEPDVGEVDAEVALQQRSKGCDALELKSHRRSHCK